MLSIHVWIIIIYVIVHYYIHDYDCLVLSGSVISLSVFFFFLFYQWETEECVKEGFGYTGNRETTSSAVRNMISLCIMRVHLRTVTKKLGFEDYN